jgi:hypothetical protein
MGWAWAPSRSPNFRAGNEGQWLILFEGLFKILRTAEADELAEIEPGDVADFRACQNFATLIENQGAAEMNRTHANRLCTAYKDFVFRRGKAEIKLLVSEFCIFL